MSTLTIRIDNKLKLEVQKMTENLGISLNQLVNLKLKEFTQTGEIHINALQECKLIDVNEPAEKVYDYLNKITKKNGKTMA